jgi:hypothetical protein
MFTAEYGVTRYWDCYFQQSIRRFLELRHVSETHQRCTREMLIHETACEDTRIEAARVLATGEGKGEEYVSRIVHFMRQDKRGVLRSEACGTGLIKISWKLQREGPAILTESKMNPGDAIKPTPRWNQAATASPRHDRLCWVIQKCAEQRP